jgi:hypothetical protein
MKHGTEREEDQKETRVWHEAVVQMAGLCARCTGLVDDCAINEGND